MIQREIRKIDEIARDPKRLAFLADEFRQGRDICDLLGLLNSDSDEIIRIGAWIAGEVKMDPGEAGPVISRLRQLLDHEKPSVRFHAINALFPFLDISVPADEEILTRLGDDPNEGVRVAAKAAVKRISQK